MIFKVSHLYKTFILLFLSIFFFLLFSGSSSNNEFAWTKGNLKKAEKIGLDTSQVIILSSLIEQETKLKKEKGKIARVYLNRLKLDMPLQSDPSIKYALGNISLKRVLKADISIESPYNTYKYRGLPPGPICEPSNETIMAVLKCKNHDYLYFCPSPKLNGEFNYASTYKEQIVNRKLYLEALNESLK